MEDTATNVIVVSATQIGKSFFGAEWTLGHAWEKPRPHPWWWTAPTYGQAMIGFNYMIAFAASAGILAATADRSEGVKGVRISYPVMTLINGAQIEARSWDKPQNLMGTPIAGGGVDEAGLLDAASHAAISSRRSGTMGPLLLLGNPGVLTGPFRRLCSMAEEAKMPGSEFAGRYSLYRWTWRDKLALIRSLSDEKRARFELPSAEEYEAFIESERATVKPEEEFRRLYEAEWTADEAAVFRRVPSDGPMREAPEAGHDYVVGADIGQQVDFLVAAVACRTCRRIEKIERWRGIPYPQSALRLEAIAETWNRAPIIIETNGPGLGVLQDIQSRGKTSVVAFTTTGPSKQEIVVSLAAQLDRPEELRLKIAEAPPMQSELGAYRYERLPSGTYRYNAPEGEHDDCVIAAALANYALIHVPSPDLSQYGWIS